MLRPDPAGLLRCVSVVDDATQSTGNVIAVVASAGKERVKSTTLDGGVESLERFHFLARDALECALFVDFLFVEHVRDGRIGDVASDTAARELLLYATARKPGTNGFAARELPGEAGVVEKAGADETIDRYVDELRGLAFADEQTPKFGRCSRAKSDHIQRAIVGGDDGCLTSERSTESLVDDGADGKL